VNTTSLIRWSTIAVVTAIAGVAGWVSYEHALAVVRAHGESGAVALAYPVTVDGLVYASSMVLLDSARRGVPVPRLARWLLAVGISATLAANVAAGLHFGPVGAIVAAWPALALVGSYELLMMLIRRGGVPAQVTIPTVAEMDQAVSAAEDVTEDVPGDAPKDVPADVPETAPVVEPVEVVHTPPATLLRTVPSTRAPRRASVSKSRAAEKVFAAEIERGELPSLRQIKTRARCGTDRARAIRDDLARLLAQAEAA